MNDPIRSAMEKHALKPDFDSLLKLAAVLRSPEGCPWDQEQTMASLKDKLEEELAEVYEAVDRDHPEDISAEIGDLLFDIAILVRIAAEKGHVDPARMFDTTLRKYISRHTWVFGDDKADSPEEAIALWKRNKAQEKQTAG